MGVTASLRTNFVHGCDEHEWRGITHHRAPVHRSVPATHRPARPADWRPPAAPRRVPPGMCQDKRCRSFHPRVPIRMVGVGVPVAVPVRIQHQHIGQQIRQRMQAVCHQRLRMCEKSAHDLKESQQQIDDNTHPGAFLRGGKALRMHRLESPDISLGLMFMDMIFHAGCATMRLSLRSISPAPDSLNNAMKETIWGKLPPFCKPHNNAPRK